MILVNLKAKYIIELFIIRQKAVKWVYVCMYCLLYDHENWLIKVKHAVKLDEMDMWVLPF